MVKTRTKTMKATECALKRLSTEELRALHDALFNPTFKKGCVKEMRELYYAIKNEVEQEYHNKDYRGFKIELPEIKRDEKTGNCWIYAGYFKCAYTFGPMVHYDIYINSNHMD